MVSTVPEMSDPWTNFTQGVDSRNESYAVLPNSVPVTATSPGRTSTESRLASGLRTISRPSRMLQGDSLATRLENTSNGSARS